MTPLRSAASPRPRASAAPFRARLLVALVLIGAGIAWNLQLGARPTHPDEAVNAIQATRYFDHGEYRYDPEGYHGPTLVAASDAWLGLFVREAAALTSERVDMALLRRVSVIAGIAVLVAAIVLARSSTGSLLTGGCTALFVALSPHVGFYVRTYIHEPFFVLGIVIALAAAVGLIDGARSLRARLPRWTVIGVAVGFVVATKETWIIAVASAALSLGLLIWTRRVRGSGRDESGGEGLLEYEADLEHPWLGPALAGISVTVVAALAFTLGQSDPIDALRAFGHYLELGSGGGDHQQRFTYYLEQLIGLSSGTHVVVSEVALIAWVVGGTVLAFRSPATRSLRFVALFAFLQLLVYSALPYKTPWLLLSFWVPALVLAGHAASTLVVARRRLGVTLVVITCVPLAWMSWNASVVRPADPRNPLAYAQPNRDPGRLVHYLSGLASVAPADDPFVVHVVGDHPWPLPWTLRRLPNVGYWASAEAYSTRAADAVETPAVLLQVGRSGTSPAIAVDPAGTLTFHYGLRPGTVAIASVQLIWQARFARAVNSGAR